MKKICLATLIMVCSLSGAQTEDPGVEVTSGDTTVRVRLPGGGLPNYFSGTSNELLATADGLVHSIKSLKIYVGGELVFNRSYPQNQLYGVFGSIRFDSTHFNNAAAITVRAEATNWANEPAAVAEFSRDVKNSFHAFARSDLERTGQQVTYVYDDSEYYLPSPSEALNWKTLNKVDPPLRFNMNYAARDVSFAENWDIDDWAGGLKLPNGQLPTPSVVFLASHGAHDPTVGGFAVTDKNDYWKYYTAVPQTPSDPLDAEYITGDSSGSALYSVRAMREIANGTGLPPRNSTSQPPVNLVAIWACCTGDSNRLSNGFLYPTSGQQAPLKNQAGVGWSINVLLKRYRTTAETLFDKLKDGWNVDEAREDAIDAYGPIAALPPVVPVGGETKILRVWGDLNTRIKGVYTGQPGQELDWKKVLN